MSLLEAKGLVTEFATRAGPIRAVDGLDFSIDAGETIGIVGESGCGKSVTSLSILRLISSPPGRIAAGEINFEGKNLLALSSAEMRQVRGNSISMIFQEPMSSLNPVLKIGRQIAEPLMIHRGMSEAAALVEAGRLLELVQIPEARRRLSDYPYQMSGGMRQRVMIAMALACRPKLLIADEPTTALDVTIQAQILELLGELRKEFGMAIMLITHDLGVVAEMASRVVVMYAGRKIEDASVSELFANPRHPYTRALLASMPRLGSSLDGNHRRLNEIPGVVPSLRGGTVGCTFAPRCPHATPSCQDETPLLHSSGRIAQHLVACHREGSFAP